MDVGMKTELKIKLTPKEDKTEDSQNLAVSIHLKEDLTVELALMHKFGIITVLLFSKYASRIFHTGNPTANYYVFLSISGKWTHQLQMITLKLTIW